MVLAHFFGIVQKVRFLVNTRRNCSYVIPSVTRDLLALALCHASEILPYARDDVRREQLPLGERNSAKLCVNQHAKMTPLGGKTASKIDPPLRCNITAG